MTDVGMQNDWTAASTNDLVKAVRQSLQSKHRTGVAPPLAISAAVSATAASAIAARAAAKTSRSKATQAARGTGKPLAYALVSLALIVAGMAGVWQQNVAFAPEMYAQGGMDPVVEAFKAGKNYAVFDLNLNIRHLRERHVASFTSTPELVVIGASQWQEAHAGLVKTRTMYDGHIHRDYWEDILGAVEVYVRNKRLPKQMIIAIRDNEFTPVAFRQDFLWEAGVDNYRAMADRLGIAKESYWKTFPLHRVTERLSLPMLFTNVTRWYNADAKPHASSERQFDSLDTLLPDGSIVWSAQHKAIFTSERSRREATALADQRRNNPPKVEPKGVAAVDKLLTFLKQNGTEVFLAHPPFNPIFYERVKGGAYMAGLDNIRQITRKLAADHGLKIIGDFDPARAGCTADMYIDAEHSSPACLARVFKEFDDLNLAAGVQN
jgi:hypothetical protein